MLKSISPDDNSAVIGVSNQHESQRPLPLATMSNCFYKAIQMPLLEFRKVAHEKALYINKQQSTSLPAHAAKPATTPHTC